MIIVLTGATGTGKSELAISLAKAIGGEIVNADAFQVYRGIGIATAAPSEAMMAEVKHHLYQYVDIDEPYSISVYQKDARKAIEGILAKGKTPILVGGSGLYIRSAIYDYDLSLDTSSIDMGGYEAMDNLALHEELEKLDPEEAHKIHANNRKRVLRAIEICLAAGESKTDLLKKQEHRPIYEAKFYALKKERDELYPLVEARVEKMFAMGLLEETLPVIEKYGRGCLSLQAIGIKELFPYIDGEKPLDEVKEAIKSNTRRYIKRQETWIRHQFDVVEVDGLEGILNALK